MDLEEELEKVVNNLDKSLEDIRKLYKEVVDQQAYYDKMLSEFYHLFESGTFPPKIRIEIDKEFDECLKKRRINKYILATLTSIVMQLKQKGANLDVSREIKGKNNFKPEILIDKFEKYKKYITFPIKKIIFWKSYL